MCAGRDPQRRPPLHPAFPVPWPLLVLEPALPQNLTACCHQSCFEASPAFRVAIRVLSSIGAVFEQLFFLNFIGSNILLAKMATKKAKPDGQYHLKPEEVDDFIRGQLVANLPGK